MLRGNMNLFRVRWKALKKSFKRPEHALVIGCHGGVGRAFLTLLKESEVGRRLKNRFAKFVLVDKAPEIQEPVSFEGTFLPPMSVDNIDVFVRLLKEHEITSVIDLSSIDTVECTHACDELGVDFLCTSIEEWPGKDPVPTDKAIGRLLPPIKPKLVNKSHLVGSGANPGIVNALALEAIEAFAERVGVAPTTAALELNSVLVTEEDTTEALGINYVSNEFPITWSPSHCIEELYEPKAFYAFNTRTIHLNHRPIDRFYRVRCGSRFIDGMVVPHEETKTLARKLPDVEVAFVYRVPVATLRALEMNVTRNNVEDWSPRRLCPPWTSNLVGQDRIGILLNSRKYGEFWMGFETDVSKGLALGTNATELQVAAGVIAGLEQLGEVKGIHFVEDLDPKRFLKTVTEILGPVKTIYDETAPSLRLVERLRSVAETKGHVISVKTGVSL